MPESEARRYIEGLIAQLNAAGKSASAYSAQNALNNGDYVGAERYATAALGFQAILPNVGVTPAPAPSTGGDTTTPSTGGGGFLSGLKGAVIGNDIKEGGVVDDLRSLLIGDVKPGSVLDSIPGIDPSLEYLLRQENPTNSNVGPDPFFLQSALNTGDPGLLAQASNALGGPSPARPGGPSNGDTGDRFDGGEIVGSVQYGNQQQIVTQDEFGQYYINGRAASMSDPSDRSIVLKAIANGTSGGGSGGGGGGGAAQTPGQIEQQRLQNALLQRELDSNPFLQVGYDSTTGRSFLIDTQTGQRTDVGVTDFASIDPERKFTEDVRQFDATDSRLGTTAANQNEISRFNAQTNVAGEDRLRAALGLQAQVSQGELNLGSAQEDRLRRALELQAATTNGEFAFAGAQEDRLRQALGLDRGVAQAGINQGLATTDTQRAQVGQNAQIANQNTDQFRFEQLRQVLANPSDFLARAFLQRGETSPSGQVTQADLINALRSEIRDVEAPQYDLSIQDLYNQGQLDPINYQTAIPQVNIQAPSYEMGVPQQQITSPQYDLNLSDIYNGLGNLDLSYNPPPPTVSTQQTAPQPTVAPPVRDFSAQPQTMAEAVAESPSLWEDMRSRLFVSKGGTMPDPVPGMADGGATRASRFITGDRPDGMLTGNEEMIINPTNAPIEVVPNPNNMPTVAGRSGINPQAQRSRLMPRFALGTYSGNDSMYNNVTQDQLIQYAQDFSPPAVTSLFNGEQPADMRFGFSLFTPQQLQQLTSDEHAALNTRLAAEFNTTLDDVVKSQSQRFGRKRQRQQGRFQL